MHGSTARLTDDGFGGSLSSDGGSKHDTPISLHGDDAASTPQRQRFFVVTNPTVDNTSSPSSAAVAAAAAMSAEFDSCTIALSTQHDGNNNFE